VVPWRADPVVLAGYLRLNLLNGSYVGHYLPQQAYIIDFAGEQLVAAMRECSSLPKLRSHTGSQMCLHCSKDTGPGCRVCTLPGCSALQQRASR
jgi:hypothetical protein